MEEEKNITLVTFTAQSNFYLDMLTAIRTRVCWFFDGEYKELIVPFVITCAAALECTLSDCLIRAFRGTPGLKSQLDGYLSMSLKGKLVNVVPVVTAQRFAINREHKSYQYLVELIGIRNRLVHNRASQHKEHVGKVTFDENDSPSIAGLEDVSFKPNECDYTFGIRGDVGRFHDALDGFHSKFVDEWDPDDFKANDLILEIEPRQTITIKVIEE